MDLLPLKYLELSDEPGHLCHTVTDTQVHLNLSLMRFGSAVTEACLCVAPKWPVPGSPSECRHGPGTRAHMCPRALSSPSTDVTRTFPCLSALWPPALW